MAYYSNDGTKYASQEWSYDSYGTVAKKDVVENRGWFSSRSSTFTYQYSATNRVLEETQAYGFWQTRTLKYNYNGFGQLRSIKSTGSFFYPRKESVETNYNINGKISSRVFFDTNGNKCLTQNWVYDYMGRVIQFTTLDGNNNLVWGSRTDYNVSYNCDVETIFDSHNETTSYIYTYYNDQGLMIERDLRDRFTQTLTITMIDYNILNQVTRVADYDKDHNMIGYIQSYYDTFARAYQQDFNYNDKDVLRDRITDYLKLPGNDL
jgi:YD repeat-containing protein